MVVPEPEFFREGEIHELLRAGEAAYREVMNGRRGHRDGNTKEAKESNG